MILLDNRFKNERPLQMPMTETLRRDDSRATHFRAALPFGTAVSRRRPKLRKTRLNLDAYVGADPINATDPSGTEECTGTRLKLPGGCPGGIAPWLSGSSTIGFGGTDGSNGGKDTSNNPGKGSFTNVSTGPKDISNNPGKWGSQAGAIGFENCAGLACSLNRAWGGWVHPVLVGLELFLEHGEAKAQVPIPSINATPAIRATLDRIERGIPYPHRNDGAAFKNREGKLPEISGVTYTEYVIPTPGFPHAGLQRLVVSSTSAIYYTPDHYETFYFVRR